MGILGAVVLHWIRLEHCGFCSAWMESFRWQSAGRVLGMET